jgi:hypothetical protein
MSFPFLILGCAILAAAIAIAILVAFEFRRRGIDIWLVSWLRRDWLAPQAPSGTRHLLFCFVDHFEPGWKRPDYATECERVAQWSTRYPQVTEGMRDADGRPPVHTFFYPEEEYRSEHLDALVGLCRAGLGEIEIHLHHDRDSEAGLREKLRRFVELLVRKHDAVPLDTQTGRPRWAFIHGNWALNNSHPDGYGCGINDELKVLAEEGCYADFTFPAAPSRCQTSTINKIYYANGDPHRPKAHDRGVRVRVGGGESGQLMIVQGPLQLSWIHRKFGFLPRIENSDIRAKTPPDARRVDAWVQTGIHVQGRPEWIFVKIHTHGAQEPDFDTLLGAPMRDAFRHLGERYNDGKDWKLHYVSAREMYNVIKAAEAGMAGDPNQYRDYLIPRPSYLPR